MKKIISSILVAVFAMSLVVFLNAFSTKAKAATEIEIYRETNTYDEKKIERNKQVTGYERGQYLITYDMDNKKTDCLVAENPTVTVFTHGYYSSAKDWLNNAEYVDSEADFDFTYNSESLIDKVIELNGGIENVILLMARMSSYEKFDLLRIALKSNYGKICQDGNLKTFEKKEMVYGKHYIVIFDCLDNNRNDSNNNLYFQFNYMLSSVLYDLKQLDPSHRIPKVNLIGHSRGGLTNMQYALDHPDIVANLISIGTPYVGSTSAAVVKNHEKIKGDGLNDIIDPEIYNKYAKRWNGSYNTLYKNINAVAIGAFSSLPFISAMAHNDNSGKIGPWATLAIDVAVPVITALKVSSFARFFLGKIAASAITKVMKLIFPKDIVFNAADILLNEIQLTIAGPVWLSDALVPLDSQLALNYKGIRKDVKYFSTRGKHNFDRVAQWQPPVVHNLEPWDEEIIKKVVNHLKPSVVDNTKNFKYKENSDGTVSISGLKAAVESSTLTIPDTINGKTVTGISSGAFAGDPSIIDKFETNVATLAANDEVNYLSDITRIEIPSSVTKISAGSFSGMESLTNVVFADGSQLNSIGENAFADCVNLSEINLPSGIAEIPYGAFENCKNLTNLTIPNGVTKIGAQAFCGAENLTNLTIPNSVTKIDAQAFCGAENLTFSSLPASVTEIGELAFFGCNGNESISLPSGITSIGDGAFAGIKKVKAFAISSANANFSVKNGILYNKAQNEIIQYPKAKDTDFFIANNDSSDEPVVREIKPYAFYDCDNLTKVDIDNVRKVGKCAFENCSSLETIFAYGLNNAEFEAFSNTLWLNSMLDNNNGKVVLGGLLILFAPENKTVMELSDWGIGLTAVAEQAFSLSDVETIYIPRGVSRLNEYAFANAQNLKDVYIEKMNAYLLSQIETNKNLFGNNHADLKIHVTRSDNEAIAEMGQNALTGIPRDVISTDVTCINNGVTTTHTIYYDEEYTLADNGTVVWESESGERYQNTGVWKSFETELTLNSLQVNNNWLTYDGENISPVSLVEGDIVSLSYTANGVITVTVNGTEYVIDLNLPVGIQISDIKAPNGQSAELNNTVYSGQFTSFNVEVALIKYQLICYYDYYRKDGSMDTDPVVITFTVDDYTRVNDVLQSKYDPPLQYKEKKYCIAGIYGKCDTENNQLLYSNEITSFTPGTTLRFSWYLKCEEVVCTITLDYGESSDKKTETVYIPFTKLDSSSNSYSFTFPTCEQQEGLTVLWIDIDNSEISFAPGATVENFSESRDFKLVRTCIGDHTLVKCSIGEIRHETKCSICDYRVESSHSLVKRSIDETKHEIKCSECDYRYESSHSFIRVSLGSSDLFCHTKRCKQCDYSINEAHNWLKDGDIFKCKLCRLTSKFIPSTPGLNSTTYLIIDEQGYIKEVSYEEALIIAKKYELEEQEDIA